jgi:hypothetical protein
VARDDADPLPVVVLRLLDGRVGSTLVMQLLATSPRIVFDRVHPYGEYRYLSYCLRAGDVIAGPHDPSTDRVTPFFFSSDGMGPIPWQPASFDRRLLRAPTVAAMWRTFSSAMRATRPGARCYAEKLVGRVDVVLEAQIPCRVIDIVRDPRDVLASIRSFTSRGVDGFGREPGLEERVYVDRYIARTRQQLELLSGDCACARLRLRYEDFATDLARLAWTLGDWLGETLDAERVLRDRPQYRDHVTTPSVEASIGRWRRDLPRHEAERIWDELADHLEPLGYAPR